MLKARLFSTTHNENPANNRLIINIIIGLVWTKQFTWDLKYLFKKSTGWPLYHIHYIYVQGDSLIKVNISTGQSWTQNMRIPLKSLT